MPPIDRARFYNIMNELSNSLAGRPLSDAETARFNLLTWEQIEFIANDTRLAASIEQLRLSDNGIKEFLDNNGIRGDARDAFESNLNILQGLSFVKLITQDSRETVNSLLGLINQKIQNINSMNFARLAPAAGGNISYHTKYLKYKAKYLGLRRI